MVRKTLRAKSLSFTSRDFGYSEENGCRGEARSFEATQILSKTDGEVVTQKAAKKAARNFITCISFPQTPSTDLARGLAEKADHSLIYTWLGTNL